MFSDDLDGLFHGSYPDHSLEHVEPAIEGLGVPLGGLQLRAATAADDLAVGGAGLELDGFILATATACAHVAEPAMKQEGEIIADQGRAALVHPAAHGVVQVLGDAHVIAAEHLQEYLVGVVSPLIYIGFDLFEGVGVVHPESSIPDEIGVVGEGGLGQGYIRFSDYSESSKIS